jgi:phosphoribosylglycinamide formyltransferase 1
MKFGFYVSNKATRLTKAIKYIVGNTSLNYMLDEIVFVYRDNKVEDELNNLCNSFGIRFIQDDLTEVKNKSDKVSSSLFSSMENEKADYLIVFGSRILKGELLKKYRNRIINFHPSLLPAFPGVKSIDQAINYGSFLIGNTAHFIDEGIDTGSIIMQNIYVLNEEANYDKILDGQIPMLFQIISWLKEDRISVSNRKVTVKNANYSLDSFIPNLDMKYQFTKGIFNEAVS